MPSTTTVCVALLSLVPATAFHVTPNRGMLPRSTSRSRQLVSFETHRQRQEPDIWLRRLADAHARAAHVRAMHVSAETAPKASEGHDTEPAVSEDESFASQLSNAQLGRAGRRLRASFAAALVLALCEGIYSLRADEA